MEEALLPERGDWKSVRRWGAFVEELKKLSYMAAPMAAVTVSQYFLQVVPVMVAGHLGELSLSGVAIATSFTNVTGFSILVGLAGALETLCGQAYGAEQYQKLGTFTYSAMISLIPICLLVSLLWTFMGKLLIFLGQDLEVSMVACRYAIWLLPALFAYAILQPLIRYFQSQCLILPLLVSSFATLSFHIPLCWALVFKFGLGTTGAALSVGISYWLNVIFLLFHLRYSPSCEKTNLLISKDIFLSIKLFFRYGLPSAVMVCLEWWSFELLILLSGLLPNSKLETSVLSICLTTTSLHYVIPYGISAAGSTRVSNELGAGNPRAARVAVCALVVLTAAEATIMATALFSCRYVFGYAYSSDKEVIDYVMEVTPLLCLSIILDSLHAVLSGVARGSGWQHIGAYVNLAAYYVVGVPVGIVLCFVLHYRGKGLWCGIVIGSAIQATSLALITVFTNWNEQAVKARKRMFEGTSSPSTGLV